MKEKSYPQLITSPNPTLRKVTPKVTSFNNDLKKQVQLMRQIMHDGGVGLAANQIGFNNRVVVIECENESRGRIPFTALINPEIIECSEELTTEEEGCLSIPRVELEVDRSRKIKLKYQDLEGHKIKIAPKGFFARVLQHEVDHLNGILFTDRIKDQINKKHPELKNLNILFCGSGEYAAFILQGLLVIGFNPDILTEPAKPAGRDKHLKPTPVAKMAEKYGKNYREVQIAEFKPQKDYDLLICTDFGQKVPENILNASKIMSLNIHPSLLPKYQGATPIPSAILAGESQTGVTIIKMAAEFDQGPILAQASLEILPEDDAEVLEQDLATLGLKLLVKSLPKIINNEIEARPQNLALATKTKKFTKADGEINWQKKPEEIDRQIRAFYPWPGTYSFIGNKRLIIHAAHLENGQLVLDIVQLEGKKPVNFSDFLKGFRDKKPDWFKKVRQ